MCRLHPQRKASTSPACHILRRVLVVSAHQTGVFSVPVSWCSPFCCLLLSSETRALGLLPRRPWWFQYCHSPCCGEAKRFGAVGYHSFPGVFPSHVGCHWGWWIRLRRLHSDDFSKLPVHFHPWRHSCLCGAGILADSWGMPLRRHPPRTQDRGTLTSNIQVS